jgi:lipoate-protein ligase A
MLVVKNENTDLRFNLAAEEYMINHFSDEVFMLWRADSSILLGKNQNAYSEINMEYVENNKIRVVRRMSGGGAVYNDLGNTNFCFIMNESAKHFTDFKRFTDPIITVLKSLGVDAQFTGRNDMTIEGKKFSGNAQYKVKRRMLHHGTLLFTSDIFDLSQSLNPSPVKFSDKAVKSVKSRVTNIWDHLADQSLDIMGFRQLINDHIFTIYPDAQNYFFSNEDLEAINKLMIEKYDTWEWNYGKSPKFNYKSSKKFPGGVVEVYAEIKNGLIQDIHIYGDYFGHKEVGDITNAFINTIYSRGSVENILSQFDLDQYFKNLTSEELMQVIFE